MKVLNIFSVTILLIATMWHTLAQSADDKFYVGEISATQILEQFPKFSKHANDVDYQNNDLSQLTQLTGDIQIKVFFGQWCHDSMREVPRVIKLLEQVNNKNISTWFYGLDTKKSDPLGLAKEHNILKTPTIIVYKDNVELGRILEVPENDWATDISSLVMKK